MKVSFKPSRMGQRIRKQREARLLSQEALGQKMGFKNGTIVSHWEAGRRLPSVPNLVALAVYLKCSTDYLVGLK